MRWLTGAAMGPNTARRRNGEAGFTLIDMLFVVSLIGLLMTLAIPGLMRARGAAQVSSAIGTLRVVNSAQLSYAITCGSGFFAPDLKTLGKKPPGAMDAYLPEDFSGSADVHEERLQLQYGWDRGDDGSGDL